jgi:large subunit ribosomal protein L5
MYMTYNHRLTYKKPREPEPPKPLTPYEANRAPAQVNLRPRAKAITYATIPKLESIIIHSMVKEAITNKQQLLNVIMALRAITGEAPGGGGRDASTGVQVVRAKQGAAAWKLREGMPVAAKVELKGDAMYDFVQSLVDFVLPRLREYPGVPIAPVSGSHLKSNMIGSVVSFGLPPIAMGLFPQIEGNIDAYPRLHGFHMYFKTNMKGEHAEMWARNLLTGFRVPFYRQ